MWNNRQQTSCHTCVVSHPGASINRHHVTPVWSVTSNSTQQTSCHTFRVSHLGASINRHHVTPVWSVTWNSTQYIMSDLFGQSPERAHSRYHVTPAVSVISHSSETTCSRPHVTSAGSLTNGHQKWCKKSCDTSEPNEVWHLTEKAVGTFYLVKINKKHNSRNFFFFFFSGSCINPETKKKKKKKKKNALYSSVSNSTTFCTRNLQRNVHKQLVS